MCAVGMTDFLDESELAEARAFVKEIVVTPSYARLRYTISMPADSRIPGRNAEDMVLGGSPLTVTVDLGLQWRIRQGPVGASDPVTPHRSQ